MQVIPEILIVDDDRELREGVAEALSDQPCRICQAGNGLEALERLRTPPPIALILLDLRMPRMNGIELLERIKADPSLPRAPIWLLSHDADAAARAEGYAIAGVLEKPLRRDALLGLLRAVLFSPH